MYINRSIRETFEKSSEFFPVMLITGARQVGKTTFLKNMANPNRKYVTLDNRAMLILAKNDPEAFLDRFSPPVLIDEIQYAPELLPYIKIIVDRAREESLNEAKANSGGMFWITGSQQFQLMQGITESLAGRVGILNMLGIAQCELADRLNVPFLPSNSINSKESETTVNDYYQAIWLGSFPQLVSSKNSREHWNMFYDSYIQTYLERDVRDILQVTDLEIFYLFLKAVAARTGQLLNYSNLARSVGISVPTAKKWINILRTSNIVYLLEPYHNNQLKRMIKTPKLYVLDTGLCSYLGNWNSSETLADGALAGAIFETWCFVEILKTYLNAGIRPVMSFYRDTDQKEIDLIIEQDGILYPIEFKKHTNPKPDSVRHFSILDKTRKEIGPGAIICASKLQIPLAKGVQVVPASFI